MRKGLNLQKGNVLLKRKPQSQFSFRVRDINTPRWCRCLPCRKKKMRCDGRKPKCSHCAKLGTLSSKRGLDVSNGVLGLDCGYNQNRKPGLQPGYVAQLQNRIGMLPLKHIHSYI